MNKQDRGRLEPFVPLDKAMMDCPAWRTMSHGARLLYVSLKRRWNYKKRNNGSLFVSQREAQKELGSHRDSISRWYRELQYYGFIVMTQAGCLGVDGKRKAPHWRITEANWPKGSTWMLPTKDYLKWDGVVFEDDRGAALRARKNAGPKIQNPGPQSRARVAREVGPGLARKVGHS